MSLPLLDKHSATLPAGQSAVWEVVRRYARGLAEADRLVLGPVLGTGPRSGFELAEVVDGERLALAGRHRFARYRLVFELRAEANSATTVAVLSFATFPGARGRLYRRLVTGTGGHVLAVRRMLRTIRREVARA